MAKPGDIDQLMRSGGCSSIALYTVAATSWGKKLVGRRFLGSGFFVSSNNWAVTCRHVLEPLADDEVVVGQFPTSDQAAKAEDIRLHPTLDLAAFNLGVAGSVFPLYRTPLMLANQVFSFGYNLDAVEDGNVVVQPRLFQGYIVGYPTINRRNLPTLTPYYELSFPGVCGFSGAPLYMAGLSVPAICGMVIGSTRAEIVESSRSEVIDGTTRYEERVSKVYEFGVAHSLATLTQGLKDLDVPAFT